MGILDDLEKWLEYDDSDTSLSTKGQFKILIAGAAAGLTVDTALHPIDTIKSRSQSKLGLWKTGSLQHLYRGIQPVIIGSVPTSALFFITYEQIKDRKNDMARCMFAASVGEFVSCAIRVPYEIVKMRSQTSNIPYKTIARTTYSVEGFAGFYRGFVSTITRDIPFSAIQFAIWENLKSRQLSTTGKTATVTQSALYGAMAGAMAAIFTNPLDVAKSRIMLAEKHETLASGNVIQALQEIRVESGLRGWFAGVLPRTMWISIGATIFLGSYDQFKALIGV